MTYKEIQDLIALINKTNLTEFKLKDGEFELSIRTNKFSKEKGNVYHTSPSMSYPAPTPPPAPVAASVPAPVKQEPAAPAAPAASDESHYIAIKSPIVGTFYRTAGPDKPPFVKVGDSVDVGKVVCIVEAMKLFNEIESEIKGKIVKVVVEDATPVEYDQVLFLVDPKG
jgi:acetyl-CoA carboxylase biotin carboxyl carrier protein